MPKLLQEFLQEQQEPFILELYLVERGYSRATTSLSARFIKALCSRLVLHKNLGNGGPKITTESREEDEDKSTTLSNSCHVGDAQSSLNANLFSQVKAHADRKLNRRSMEYSNKQLSPVSVLDQQGSPFHDNNEYNSKTSQGEASTSVSQCKPTHYHSVQESQQLRGGTTNTYTQFIINKRALQQTKQLLIDSVREVIENHMKRDDKSGQHLNKVLGTEELWKLVCENVWLWSQDSIDEANIIHLLKYDFMASVQVWKTDSEQQKKEISMEIGDAILEGVINEMVTG